MKILVVEDDEFVAEALSSVLVNQNYAVEVARDGEAAADLIDTFDYDLVLLDVMLPKLDGISLCRQMRSHGLQIPILLLTGRDSGHDKAQGLDAGADDYVVKPFDIEELVARIRALLRRSSGYSQPVLEWGDLHLDPSSFEVRYGTQKINLTPKEYALLELFLRNSRRVFSCGMILEHLWSYDDTPGEEAVRTHIKGLRQKLKAAGAPGDVVETVYGIGYRLKPQGKDNSTSEVSSPKTKTPTCASTETSPSSEQTLVAIANIWQRFQGRVSAQVAIIEQAATALAQQTLSSELHNQAQKELHTLAGSLGTFGLTNGSQIARQLEQLLKHNPVLNATQTQTFTELVTHLRQEVDNSMRNGTDTPPSPDQPLLLVVDRDRQLTHQLHQAAAKFQLQLTVASDLHTAQHKLYNQHPNVVLLDPNISPNWSDSLQLLTELNSRKPPVPVLVLTEQTNFAHRLAVARSGGHTFLQKPLPAEQILQTVATVLQQTDNGEAKVLAVDDDPQILALLHTLLEPWGIQVTTLDDPRAFWQTLQTVQPDLLILDVEMPEVNGIELCQVVRNDSHWSELPIVFLTVHNDADIINSVFTVGADDYVSKPIVGPELVTRIINRLERIRLRQQIAQTFTAQNVRANLDATVHPTNQSLTGEPIVSHTSVLRLRQQATVANLGLSAALGKDLSELMAEAVQLVAQNLEVEYCKLLEVLPDGKSMLLRAGVGWREGLVGSTKVDYDDSTAGHTLSVQHPVIVADLCTETRFAGSALLHDHNVISGLSVPIPKLNGSYGVLAAYTSRLQKFTQDDVNFIQSVANVLSGVLERQYTEETLRRAKDELELRVAERTAELIRINQQLQLELSERLQVQEALRNSQARFAGIVEIADDAIITIDGQQRITLFNQGAEKIFGYGAAEVLGQPLDILLPQRFAQVHRRFVADFGEGVPRARRMAERREIYGQRCDGTEFPAEASISKLNLGGEVLYTVYLQDISGRKQVERMKDEFVSVVSHELRTPLTSIHGSLGMLASGLIPPDTDQGKRLLQIAVDSSDRLVRLINDILDIERIESGKVSMNKQACRVGDMITASVNVMQPLADKAAVHLSLAIDAVQDVCVYVDADRIVQTFTNLLSNAIKFSPAKSTVSLKGKVGGEEVVFTIKDSGRGIPADQLESIFERFQQVDSSDSRNHDGTGLGLAICRSIIQQHGGRIWVESSLGQGSLFHFSVPISGSLAIAKIATIEPQTAPLVLVCDDDMSVRNQLQTLLVGHGYQVVMVNCGEDAITQARATHPDVILLDVVLPGMNGWEVIAALKAQPATQDIPIVVCSICSCTLPQHSHLEYIDWVCKPVDKTSLFYSLQQALAKSQRKFRILIVEDDTDFAQLLITVLQSHNIETYLATTGREAIRRSQEINPDLLILDLVLPKGDGFAVVEWLQQHNRLHNIPLVVYSAQDLDKSERDRLQLGHTEFLTKGRVTTVDFEQQVMQLLHKLTQARHKESDNGKQADTSS